MSIEPTSPPKRTVCQRRRVDLVCLTAFWIFFIEAVRVSAWAAPASANPPDDLTQLSLKELLEIEIDTVYSASRRLQRTTEAPSSVSIVTSEEVKKYGHKTLTDILRSVRGLYVTYDRNYIHSREKQIPTASFGTVFNDPRANTIDTFAYADLKFQRQLADSTELMARVSYDRYYYEGDYPFDYVGLGNPRDVVISFDQTVGEWFTAEMQANRTFFDRLKLTLGGEFRENFRQDQLNIDRKPYTPYVLDQRSIEIIGLYGQGELSLLTNLLLSAGIRWDH